jgi:putative ABC transport system permease protein
MGVRGFWGLFFRYLGRGVVGQWGLGVLNVLAIGLGMAVFLAIQIANGSANRSFRSGMEVVSGRADLEVRGRMEDGVWRRLAGDRRVRAATGVVEGVLTLPGKPGEYLRVVGVDLFTNGPFHTFRTGGSEWAGGFEQWLAAPHGVVLHPAMAARLNLKTGDVFEVLANSERRQLTVLGFLEFEKAQVGGQSRLALMDLGWAQELFGKAGFLDAVELILREPLRGGEIAEELRAGLPPDLEVEPPLQRSIKAQKMLAAFELNLTALSMVSLLVGTFLIYGTVSGSVIRRRTEIGILRALGGSTLQVRCLFLGEGLLYGGAGGVLGAVGGVWLARVLVGAVARTVSSLYALVEVEALDLGPAYFCVAGFAVLASVVVGAWVPASEAAQVTPMAALSSGGLAWKRETEALCGGRLAVVLGIVAVGMAGVARWVGPPWLGFGAAFFVLTSFAACAPACTVKMAQLGAWVCGGQILGRLAAGNLGRHVYRNGITAGALGVAVAMLTALMVMIYSFRETVGEWVGQTVVADLFVAPASNELVGLGPLLPEAVVHWLRGQAGVEGVDGFFEKKVRIAGRPVMLSVLEGADRGNLRFRGGDGGGKMAVVLSDSGVAVSESFASHFRVKAGGRIELETPRGIQGFGVAGVFSDYSRDQGVVLMSRGLFEKFWSEQGTHSAAVYLKKGADPADLENRLRTVFSGEMELSVYSNRELRERIFAVFDQTFAVTRVLRWIAVFVALVGMALAVGTLVEERRTEVALLRALGASRGQVCVLFLIEAAMVGLLASILGLVSGMCLSVVLTHVVNPAFFGWTIGFRIPFVDLAWVPLWIVGAAVVAGMLPLWRRENLIKGLRSG